MQIVRIGKFRKPPYEENVICPRCDDNSLPLGYPGALSRVDNITEICSICGTDEGLTQHFAGILAPISTWPVNNLSISEEIHQKVIADMDEYPEVPSGGPDD
jgi:hypothetical protein